MIFNPCIKLAKHKEFIQYLSDETLLTMLNIEVSPTSLCNANCPCCFYKYDRNKKDDFINMSSLIDFLCQGSELSLKSVTWSGGGEPSLHPEIDWGIKRVNKRTILKQGMFTNALAPIKYEPSFLEWIRITKTDKDFPVNNIKIISESCKQVGIAINYSSDFQDDEIKKAIEIAYKYNLEYVQIRPALNIMGVPTQIKQSNIQDEKLVFLDWKFSDCKKIERGYTRCEGFHFSPMIWENGNIDVCMYMRHDPIYNLGNIYKSSFDNICRKMPEFLPVKKDCQICCKNNEINLLIHNAKTIKNSEFI